MPTRQADVVAKTPVYRTRPFVLALGIVTTMLVLAMTARLDRLDRPSAWSWGWIALVTVAVPALFYWSDLIYRSVLVVWTIAVVLGFIGTFGYFWWPLVMVPFAWIAAVASEDRSAMPGVALLAGAIGLGAVAVPIASAIVPPVESTSAIVCFKSTAPSDASEAVFAALKPTDRSFGYIAGVNGVGSQSYDGDRQVAAIVFDRYATDEQRRQVVEKISAVPQVARVVESTYSGDHSLSRSEIPCG